MTKVKEPNRAAAEQLGFDLQNLESRAHRLGLHVTARGVNRAKNALGWEMAGEIEQAGEALKRG